MTGAPGLLAGKVTQLEVDNAVGLRSDVTAEDDVATAVAAGRGGSIINMSSLSGKSGNPGQTNYSPAKAGIIGLTKAAAKELAHHEVRVNAVQPGLIRAAMIEANAAGRVRRAGEGHPPMRRAGLPEEVAGAAVFLASNLSSYMTGAVFEVGGGRFM